MKTLGPLATTIVVSALLFVAVGTLRADGYPRILEVPADGFPYFVPNHNGNVEVHLLGADEISANIVDRLVSVAVETQPTACNRSTNFRIESVASWSEVLLALVSRTGCGSSDHRTLVRYDHATAITEVLWSNVFPSFPTTTSFRTIAEAPDRGLVVFRSIPWYEGGGDVQVIDFLGNHRGQFGVERFLGPKEVSGTEIVLLVQARFLAGTECPTDVNDEHIKNNESLVSTCHIREMQTVVFWARGCSQLAPTTSVFGCSGRYCGPLPGEPTPDDVIPQFTNLSELPSECSYWNP